MATTWAAYRFLWSAFTAPVASLDAIIVHVTCFVNSRARSDITVTMQLKNDLAWHSNYNPPAGSSYVLFCELAQTADW